jgi:hypothetical protein
MRVREETVVYTDQHEIPDINAIIPNSSLNHYSNLTSRSGSVRISSGRDKNPKSLKDIIQYH